MWPWQLPEEWPEACGSLTVVGAATKHGFGTDPIRNPTIWLAESRNQVNYFAYRGRIKVLAWSSIAQSVCQRALSLLEIRFQKSWVRILHSAKGDNLFLDTIAVAWSERAGQLAAGGVASVIGMGYWVQVFSLILNRSVSLSAGIQSAGDCVRVWCIDVCILHSADQQECLMWNFMCCLKFQYKNVLISFYSIDN